MAGETFSGVIETLIKPEAIKDFDVLYEKIGKNIERTKEFVTAFGAINTNISNNGAAFTEYKNKLKELEDAKKRMVKLETDLIKIQDELAKARERGRRGAEGELSAAEKLAKAQLDEIKNKQDATKYTAALAKEKERIAKAAEKEKTALEKANSEYDRLNARYIAAAKQSQNMGAALLKQANGDEKVFQQLLKTDAAYIAATNDAKKYYEQLDLLENNVGKAQRRVGQYERAQFALNQVLREAPAFTNSIQTGILGISNNIPQLTDEFAKLRGSGLTAFQSIKVLGQGLFSITGILPLLITAAAVAAPKIADFFEGLGDGKEKAEAAKKAVEDFKKSLDEAAGSGADAAGRVTTIFNALRGGSLNAEQRNNALKELKEINKDYFGQLKEENGAITGLNASYEAYIKNVIEIGKAKAIQSEIQKLFNEKLQLELNLNSEFLASVDPKVQQRIGVLTQKLKALGGPLSQQELQTGNLQNETLTKRLKLQEQIAELQRGAKKFDASGDFAATKNQIDVLDLRIKGLSQLQSKLTINSEFDSKQKKEKEDKDKVFTKDLEDTANYYKKLSEIEIFSLDSRNQYRQAAASVEREIEGLRFANKEISEKEHSLNVRKINNELFTDLLKIRQSFIARQQQLDKEAEELFTADEKARAAREKEALDKNLKEQQDFFIRRKQLAEANRDAELLALDERFTPLLTQEGVKSEERLAIVTKYNAEKLRIQNRYDALILQAELDAYQQSLIYLQQHGLDTTAVAAKIAALELAINKEKNKALLDDTKVRNQAEEELEKQRAARLQQLGLQARDAFFSFLSGAVDRRKNEIQDAISSLEELTQAEIKAVDQLAVSEEEKAARIIKIRAKEDAEKKRLTREQKKLDEQAAIFDRLRQLFELGITTAKTVFAIQAQAAILSSNPATLPLAPKALAQIPIVLAGSALTTAAILAKPIPKFRTGKDFYNDYEGPAEVSEDGPEMYVDKGKVQWTPSQRSIMWVSKTSQIIPHDKAMQLYKTSHLSGLPGPYSNANTTVAIDTGAITQPIIKAIEKSKAVQVTQVNINMEWMRHYYNHVLK
ncbi:MAG: hypothetical protein SFU21_10865 [Flavihumibacter sp.]|nr:hypothetical protein [Flavihumibacter sp.]